MPEALLQSICSSPVKGAPLSSQRFRGVWRLVTFFACCAGVAVALHMAVNRGLRSIKTSQFGAFNAVVSGQVNADILINGSSRALCHYDPRIIQEITGLSAYNIGMNASQIDVQLAVLKTYLRHNTRPRLVIQNLDLFSFQTTIHGEIYDPGFFIPYLSEVDLYNGLSEIDPAVHKWRYVPLYGYAVEDMRFTWVWGFLGLLNVDPPETHFRGFNPRKQSWNRDFENFTAGHQNGVRYRVDPKGRECLEEILTICRSNNISAALVYSPEYIEMQRFQENRTEIMGMFRDIAERYNTPLFDYSDSPLSRNRELFNNSQHMNQIGAHQFTFEFATNLVSWLPRRVGR